MNIFKFATKSVTKYLISQLPDSLILDIYKLAFARILICIIFLHVGQSQPRSPVKSSWVYSINELRSMMVQAGRVDPVLSGINPNNDKVILPEHKNGYVLGSESDVNKISGNDQRSNLSRSMNLEHTARQTPSEHISAEGRLKASICDQSNGFLRKQRRLCLQYLHLMESVIRGYFMGLRECEYQFAMHRWNCQGYNHTIKIKTEEQSDNLYSTDKQTNLQANSKEQNLRTYMDRLLSSGTIESAYVLAITSAGISHAVTKACSSGAHENCGCDRTIYDHERKPNFEWSGCSDNIHFGAAFSRKFLDAREKNKVKRNPKLGLTNLHNNHVGRQTVVGKMDIKCKCHGVSGSCEMRTCWRALPDFRSVGDYLRERSKDAVFVEYINNRLVSREALFRAVSTQQGRMGMANGHANSPRLNDLSSLADLNGLPMPTARELIYASRSPSYCNHDPRHGSLGTQGRRCSEVSSGPDNCAALCCRRHFRRDVYLQEEKCECKFHWCCEVRCQICRKTVIVSTCN